MSGLTPVPLQEWDGWAVSALWERCDGLGVHRRLEVRES